MRIYVAGPITGGNTLDNVQRALAAATELVAKGFCPYVPHLTYFWDKLHPHPYETWLGLDFEWLRQCDAVLRLPGRSAGADKEETLATELGIPVFHSLKALLAANPKMS